MTLDEAKEVKHGGPTTHYDQAGYPQGDPFYEVPVDIYDWLIDEVKRLTEQIEMLRAERGKSEELALDNHMRLSKMVRELGGDPINDPEPEDE